MAIYAGVVSHKGHAGSDHLTGEIRNIDGATDNADLAIAFGVSPAGTGKSSSNGKIQLTELVNLDRQKPIYVDHQELDKIDDLTFIKNHINSVSDWQALAQFMGDEHNVEIRAALVNMNLKANYATLSNSQRSAIVRYIFGRATEDEVKTLILQDDPQLLTDVISRSVLGKSRSRTFEAFGLTGTITVTSTETYAQTEDERLKITPKTVSIPIITKVVVEGSKAGFNSKSVEVEQFVSLKRFLTSTMIADKDRFNIPTRYTHRIGQTSDLETLSQELTDKVFADINNSISQYLKAVHSLTPEIVGIERLDDFNPISTWKRLLNELGIETTPFTNLDKAEASNDLKAYEDNKITATEFLNKYSGKFVEVLKTKLKIRFEEGSYNADAYFERIKDTLQDIIIFSNEKKEALNIVTETVNDYREIIESINDVNELLELYHQSNMTHDNAIIDEASKRLMEFISNKRQDENVEIYDILKDYFSSRLSLLIDSEFKSANFVNKANIRLDLLSSFKKKKIEQAFTTFLAQAPQNLSGSNYRDIIDNFVGGMWDVVDMWLDEFFENIQSEQQFNRSQIVGRLVEIFESEMDRNTEKDVLFDTYELAERYGVDVNISSKKFIDQFEKIIDEMSNIALYDQIEEYFNSLPTNTLQRLLTLEDQIVFVRDVYDTKLKKFVSNVIEKYDGQLHSLANEELSHKTNSKMLLSELAKTRNPSYYLEVAKDFIQEYLDITTAGHLTFDVKNSRIADELKTYQSILANWLDATIKQIVIDSDSIYVQHINEVGNYETDFISWQRISDKIYDLVGHKVDIWLEVAKEGFVSTLYTEKPNLSEISAERIIKFMDSILEDESEFFEINSKSYAKTMEEYFKDKMYGKEMLISALKSQIIYAANFDGKVFEKNGLTLETLLDELEIDSSKVSANHKIYISNVLDSIKQAYFEECFVYISNLPKEELEKLFADVDILEVDPEKLHRLLADNISVFTRKAKDTCRADLNELETNLVEAYHDNKLGKSVWTRAQWQMALEEYAPSELAKSFGWGIDDEALQILKELHRDNILRSKIEDYLEECNFHTEVELWMKGQYDFSEALNIFHMSSWHRILDEYLDSKNFFTEETIRDYFNTNAKFDNELLRDLRYEWNRAFTLSLFNKLTEDQDSLISMIDFKNKTIKSDKFIEYIDTNKEKFKEDSFRKIRNKLARNLPTGQTLTDNFSDILQAYLTESLESYLRSNHIPEKLINNSVNKNNFINLFMESDEIIKYYEVEKDNVDARSWLKVNLPFENLNNKCWSKRMDRFLETYYRALIDKIYDDTHIDYTTSAYDAILKHPKEAAAVYDDKMAVDDFVEAYMLSED